MHSDFLLLLPLLIVIPNLPAGKYEAIITYEGDDKYLSSTTKTKFEVRKNSAPVSANDDYIKIGDDGTVVVNLPSDATGTVTIIVNGHKYTMPVIDGKAEFKIPGLKKGDHDVIILSAEKSIAHFAGSARYGFDPAAVRFSGSRGGSG